LRKIKVVKDMAHLGGHEGDPTLQKTDKYSSLSFLLLFSVFDLNIIDKFNRIFGGLIKDVKRKAKWYLSDFKDGFNFQCISSIGFMYFACLAPIIAFGGLLDLATDKSMVSVI